MQRDTVNIFEGGMIPAEGRWAHGLPDQAVRAESARGALRSGGYNNSLAP